MFVMCHSLCCTKIIKSINTKMKLAHIYLVTTVTDRGCSPLYIIDGSQFSRCFVYIYKSNLVNQLYFWNDDVEDERWIIREILEINISCSCLIRRREFWLRNREFIVVWSVSHSSTVTEFPHFLHNRIKHPVLSTIHSLLIPVTNTVSTYAHRMMVIWNHVTQEELWRYQWRDVWDGQRWLVWWSTWLYIL